MKSKARISMILAFLFLLAFPLTTNAQPTQTKLIPAETQTIVIEFDGDGTIATAMAPDAMMELTVGLTKVNNTTVNIHGRILNTEGGFCYYSLYLERRVGTTGQFSSYKSWTGRSFTGYLQTDTWDESVERGYQYQLTLSASTASVSGSLSSTPLTMS